MTLKDRSFFWYVRNLVWLLAALVPLLWWLPFFRVGKKLHNKRYRTIGYVQLGICICLTIGTMTELVGPCIMLLMLQWPVCFVWSLMLVKPCLIQLKERENRQQLEQKLAKSEQAAPVQVPRQEAVEMPRTETVPVEEPQQEVKRLNVNNCTEEELCALPGISIIEAKKMSELRQTRGDFATVEQFVAAIGIKPHVAARIVDRLYAEPTAVRAAAKVTNRVLDF